MKFAAEGLLHELERPDCVSGARGADRHVSAVHEEYAGLREPNGFRVREEEEKRPRNARRNPHRCQFHIKWPVFQYEIIIFRGNSPLFFSEIMNFAFKMMNDFLHYCLLHYCLLHYYLLYYYLLHYYILHYCLLYYYLCIIIFCIITFCIIVFCIITFCITVLYFALLSLAGNHALRPMVQVKIHDLV